MKLNFTKLLNMKYIMFVYDLYVVLFHIWLQMILINEDTSKLFSLNFISIILYLVMFKLIEYDKIKLAYFLTLIEIICFSFLATIYIGNDTLFYTYNIAIMPIMAINIYYEKCIKTNKLSFYIVTGLIFFICCFLFFTESLFIGFNPEYIISEYMKVDLRFANSINIISAIIFGCCLFLTLAIVMHINYENLIKENKFLALRDGLTGLLNRNALNEEMLRLEKEDETFGIVLADIDDFKKINDLYGHDCGDFVLKEIAEICISKLDENINIYRFGGEEILFIYKDIDNPKEYFDKLREYISTYEFLYYNKKIPVTLTFGVSKLSTNFNKAVNSADSKLYQGKRKGKNIVIY